MEILTTPDDAADGLPDSDVDRHYMTIPDDDNRVLLAWLGATEAEATE